MCNVTLSTIERSPPQAGFEPGTARSVDQSYRGSLQNKPQNKDGLVEEEGGRVPTYTLIRTLKPYMPSFRNFFFFLFCFVLFCFFVFFFQQAKRNPGVA